MNFNSIKTASLGAFAMTILGTTAISGTAQARPYESGSDWNANGWRNYSTNVEFDGWSSHEPQAGKRGRHARKQARVPRTNETTQAFAPARGDNAYMGGNYTAAQSSYDLSTSRQSKRVRNTGPQAAPVSGIGGGDLVSEARRYIGGNPTGRSSLWCGAFMDLIL